MCKNIQLVYSLRVLHFRFSTTVSLLKIANSWWSSSRSAVFLRKNTTIQNISSKLSLYILGIILKRFQLYMYVIITFIQVINFIFLSSQCLGPYIADLFIPPVSLCWYCYLPLPCFLSFASCFNAVVPNPIEIWKDAVLAVVDVCILYFS